LNVPHEGEKDIAETQAEGVIRGVIDEKIPLDKKIRKSPKLFIVSGNAQSGKDDIIRAAKKLGKQQTDILKKYSTRWAEDGDEGEIICKFIPKSNLLQQYEDEYQKELIRFEKEYLFDNYINNENGRTQGENKRKDGINYSVKFEIDKMVNRNEIKTGYEHFWLNLKKAIKEKQETIKDNSAENGLSESAYKEILSKYFDQNPEYIDLEKIAKENEQKYKDEINKIDQRIKSMPENSSGCLQYKETSFVLYENNKKLYGNPIYYGYEIDKYVRQLKSGDKHIVLTASLPNMFKICREHFGEENVITAYTYSQISQKEHIKNSIDVTGPAKLQEYNDILRYASHIEDFDYALIFAETSIANKSGNQKDELVDQMFRLFRVYNSDILKEKKMKLFVLAGPSGIGKSTLLSKIVEEGLCGKASKYSNRKKRENIFDDITFMEKNYIEKNCDIKYDMYGNKYGFIKEEIEKKLNNENLVVICRHIKAIKMMKKYFEDKISIIFIYLQDVFVENLLKAYIEREGLKYDDQLLSLAKNISHALKTKNKVDFNKLDKEFIKKMKGSLGIKFKCFYERYKTMIYSEKYYVRNRNLFNHTIFGNNVNALFDEFYKIIEKQEYM
jgi:guanylate kinase